ncbi:MAG: hypothetical protein IT378_23060 [Sandaracinaceae bacterium]|nr:hypothetical protein [Sandaracinaceae bacterium]
MIPSWNDEGLIPPIRPGEPGHSMHRAPYRAPMLEVAQRFGSRPLRCAILSGLLDLRARLRAAGLDRGFQWLDGSLMERIEVIEGRPPKDVDVITFVHLGDEATQQRLAAGHPDLFAGDDLFERLRVDHYFFNLDLPLDQRSVKQVSYWYSMWSHRRDLRWKGFVQVDLAEDDGPARSLLDALAAEAESPGVAP